MARNMEFASRVSAKVSNLKGTNPDLTLVDYECLSSDKSVFRIITTHPSFSYEADKYVESVNTLFDNKMSLVAGTLVKVENPRAGETTHTMIVATNKEVRPYTEASTKGMKLITANMYEDSNEDIWNVVGEGNDRNLVQLSDDDSEAIMAARISKRSVTASTVDDVNFEVQNGDYVLAYDLVKDTVVSGFLLSFDDGIKVVDRNNLRNVTISHQGQIVACVEGASLNADNKGLNINNKEIVATFTADQAKAYLDYARVLYGNSKYFTDLEALINERLSMGPNAMSTNTTGM